MDVTPSATCPTIDESKLDSYTDAELLTHIAGAHHIVTTRIERHAKALSPQLIAKFATGNVCHDEIAALKLARELGVRVPAVRRCVVVDAEADDYVIIQERIHGRTLEQAWPGIGWWKTIQLGLQLRRYLQAMHAVTSTEAGGLATGAVSSTWFESLFAPMRHASPFHFTEYLNWWLISCQPSRFKPRADLLLNPPHSHCFIHQDLAPRNMIVDSRNTLWLVDWGYAGFYPDYMENAGFGRFETHLASSWKAWFARWRWAAFRWIAIGRSGRYEKQTKALGEVYRRSCIYRLDRAPYSEVS